MGKDILIYRIHHLIKMHKSATKQDDSEGKTTEIHLNVFDNAHILSPNGKKNQMIEQIISEAIVHFTTYEWNKNEKKIGGDILRDLSGENGRMKAYGTLIQDSRRR